MNMNDINRLIRDNKKVRYLDLFKVEFDNIVGSVVWRIGAVVFMLLTFMQLRRGSLIVPVIESTTVLLSPMIWAVNRCMKYRVVYNNSNKN